MLPTIVEMIQAHKEEGNVICYPQPEEYETCLHSKYAIYNGKDGYLAFVTPILVLAWTHRKEVADNIVTNYLLYGGQAYSGAEVRRLDLVMLSMEHRVGVAHHAGFPHTVITVDGKDITIIPPSEAVKEYERQNSN